MSEPAAPDPGSDSALDDLILSAVDDAWCKVAVLLSRVVDAANAKGLDITGQVIAARLYALVENGRVDAKGNVRRWRAGEVRRKSG